MIRNFIFLGVWYDKLMEISDEEMRKDFAWRIIKYGATGELDLTDNAFANLLLKNICGYIAEKKVDYSKKALKGKTGEERRSFDVDNLRKLIAEGRTAENIAEILGVTRNVVYHNSVWKNRKKYDFYRHLPEVVSADGDADV